VGTSVTTSFLDSIKKINDAAGTNIQPVFVRPRLSGYIDRTIADTTKAQKILGFKSKVNLREGVRKVVRSVIEREHAIN